MKESPVKANSSVGIVLATHGSKPYLHVQLECLKRHEPDVAILIHDDSSDQEDELRALAKEYGADFHTTGNVRLTPTVGDLSAYVQANRWGERVGIDIAIKCSRSFIVNKPWSRNLVELMSATHMVTACAPCGYYKFGLRSEVCAMLVRPWLDSGIVDRMEEAVRENQNYCQREGHDLPEAYYHRRIREVHRFVHPISDNYNNTMQDDCNILVRSEQEFPRPGNYDGYVAWWQVFGLSRHTPPVDCYWHDATDDVGYATLAQSLGLDYKPSDFTRISGE